MSFANFYGMVVCFFLVESCAFLGHNTVVVRSCEEDTLDTTSLPALTTESLSEEMIRQIFAGIRLIITLALRQPSLKAEVSQHLLSYHPVSK